MQQTTTYHMNSVLSYMSGGRGNSRHIVRVIIKVIINAILFIMIFLPIVEVSNKYGVTNLKHEAEARCVQVIFIIMIFLPCLGKELACHKLPHGICRTHSNENSLVLTLLTHPNLSSNPRLATSRRSLL